MGIQPYMGKSKPMRQMRIVGYPPDVYVRILGPADCCVKLWLHRRGMYSYPCLGDECEDCGDDRFAYGYAPVEVGDLDSAVFFPRYVGILPVTSEGLDMCLHDLQEHVLHITRTPKNKRGSTTWKIAADLKDLRTTKAAPCFDVMPHLYNLWRYFAKKSQADVAQVDNNDITRRVIGKIGQAG